MPAADGISTEEAISVIDAVTERIDDICSFDLVELNPLRDKDRMTERTASEILEKMISAAAGK